MKSGLKSIFGLQLLAAAVALAACSGLPQSSTSTGGTGTGTGFTIGGSVTGLTGTGLVLKDNGADNLTITKSGTFVFPTAVSSGGVYAVTVASQPTNPPQSCSVTGGSGNATANVTSVAIACTNAAANATVGVTVSGLTGTGLVLQDNGGDSMTVTANGSYTFKSTVNGAYDVTVLSQPTAPTQLCTVTKGSGIATANVTGIPVSCVNSFTVGGQINGLVGTGLVLQNNNTDNFTATANGAFTFKTQVATGAAYSVTVLTQPTTPPQTCVVATGTGSGTTTANVTSVVINCKAVTFSVGGNVVGLAGRTPTPPSQINLPLNDNSFEIQNNLGNTLIIPQNGPFLFATPEALNDQYQVSVFHSASSQNINGCTLWNYKGVVTANVTSIVIDCGRDDWTWIDGTKTAGVAGTPQFGAFPTTVPTATPNPLTNTPGARYGAATWTDNNGTLFLFGGTGFELTGNPVPDTLNAPMQDMWACVVLDDGCQWQLVGGYDPTPVGGGTNPPTKGQTVIQVAAQHEGQTGNATVPASRLGASTWKDQPAGNLWLFGGATGGTTGAHFLNDLWKYDMTNLSGGNYTGAEGVWSQVAGGGGVDQAGVYTGGTVNPGSRTNAASWTDASGNFWLFGGHGYDASGSLGDLNDLWEYTAGHWIFVSGGLTNTINQKGIYGAQGVAAASNMPGGRQEAAAWADLSGNLWLFGGEGEDANGTANGILNDLWMYNISSGQWTYVAGSNAANQTGNYPAQPVVGSVATTTAAGTCGLAVGDPAESCAPISLTGTYPGSRWGANAWVDTNGSLWLFGGWGLDSTGTNGNGALNDLWVYTPNATPGQLGTWAWIKGSNTGAQNGVYASVNVMPWVTYYQFTPGGRSNAAAWVDGRGQFWMFGGEGYDSTSTTGNGYLNDMWRYLPYQ